MSSQIRNLATNHDVLGPSYFGSSSVRRASR